MTCGTSKPDVADGAADGNGQAGQHRCGDVDDQLDACDVHAEMHGLSLAGEQEVEVGGGGQDGSRRGKEAAPSRSQSKPRGSEVERSPISQKAMPRRSRLASVVIKNMMMAERNDAVMMPAK